MLTEIRFRQPGKMMRTVTVVGGHGAMGHFFVERLSLAGHYVQILEQNDWHRAETLLTDVDLVLLCVPLQHTLSVIQQVAPYLAPTTVLADIASVKVPFVSAMLRHHPGPVVGLHPMFGPGTSSFSSQTVVACPGRQSEKLQWLFDLIETEGGVLVTSTPDEHDRMMVNVQAIRHFFTFSLGVFLAEEGIDIDKSLDFATPLYRSTIHSIRRLFDQNDYLPLELMAASPEREEAIHRLVTTCDRLSNLLAQGDREGLEAEFDKTRQSFEHSSSFHCSSAPPTTSPIEAAEPNDKCAIRIDLIGNNRAESVE
jgi:prephenate dehydrogenase